MRACRKEREKEKVRNKGERNNVAMSSSSHVYPSNAKAISGLCAPRYCLASIDCLGTALETVSGYVTFEFAKWNKERVAVPLVYNENQSINLVARSIRTLCETKERTARYRR